MLKQRPRKSENHFSALFLFAVYVDNKYFMWALKRDFQSNWLYRDGNARKNFRGGHHVLLEREICLAEKIHLLDLITEESNVAEVLADVMWANSVVGNFSNERSMTLSCWHNRFINYCYQITEEGRLLIRKFNCFVFEWFQLKRERKWKTNESSIRHLFRRKVESTKEFLIGIWREGMRMVWAEGIFMFETWQ